MPDNICGLYFLVEAPLNPWGYRDSPLRKYLPQVANDSRITINTTSYSVELEQTFINPTDQTQENATFAFPLYDGVVVTDFVCTIGDRTIRGKVKEKQQARREYDTAVEDGKRAALLESLPAGIFSVSVGNIPPHSNVKVRTHYGGELKHDAQIDGIRYTLPLSIAPRYGSYPGELVQSPTPNTTQRGMKVNAVLDLKPLKVKSATTPSNTFKSLLSTQLAEDASAQFSGHLSLDLTSAEMDEDFVLLIEADGLSEPQALLERLPDQSQTVMATFVPKFRLPNNLPEIVFIADQSGSMDGSKNKSLKSALTVFLKSLPRDVHFNVCAFGSRHEFVFPKSQPYTKETLNKALAFVKTFEADYGGTEMQQPVELTFKKMNGKMPLEVVLLTDGEIWGEDTLFKFISHQINDKKVDARVFCLGIGSDVSHTLVEGVARTGRGLAQFVTEQENLDKKVVRMLKASLHPHLDDVKMEVTYEKQTETEDEFVLVDRTVETRKGDDHDQSKATSAAPGDQSTSPTSKKPNKAAAAINKLGRKLVSLYDKDADLDGHIPGSDAATASKLEDLVTPDSFDAPLTGIPLYPFNRTTIYHHEAKPLGEPVAVRITATCAQGDLCLEIPLKTVQSDRGTITKLAARNAIEDLLGNRGFLSDYRPAGADRKLKDLFVSDEKYETLVKKAVTDIGVKHQIASKYTSFVAIDEDDKTEKQDPPPYDGEHSLLEGSSLSTGQTFAKRKSVSHARGFGAAFSRSAAFRSPPAAAPSPRYEALSAPHASAMLGGGPPAPPPPGAAPKAAYGSAALADEMSFDMGIEECRSRPPAPSSRRREDKEAMSPAADQVAPEGDEDEDEEAQDHQAATQDGAFLKMDVDEDSDDSVVRDVISAQDFDGYWEATASVLDLLGLKKDDVNAKGLSGDTGFTMLVLAVLEAKYKKLEDVWELCAGKAKEWLASKAGKEELGSLEAKARELV